ncbi:MAG TPA: hypothetical protein VGD31_07180 [Sphingobacteriaceae bacterium]
MQKIKLLFFAGIALVAASCSSSLDRDEFIAWVTDYENGLHVKQEHEPYIFDLQFQPADFVRLQRQDNTTHADLKAMQYYTLKIGTNGQGDFLSTGVSSHIEKQQKLYYFSYLFQDNIKLHEENGDVLPCVLYHFEKGLNKESTFVLGFENPLPLSKSASLVLESEEFGSFPVKIKISKDNIPSLKTHDENNL